uniref:CX domain-containing protein n=1 Tax=Parastrongyloides trichosuri TaxID=131310 RepID=A0A0N4Z764_PARTI
MFCNIICFIASSIILSKLSLSDLTKSYYTDREEIHTINDVRDAEQGCDKTYNKNSVLSKIRILRKNYSITYDYNYDENEFSYIKPYEKEISKVNFLILHPQEVPFYECIYMVKNREDLFFSIKVHLNATEYYDKEKAIRRYKAVKKEAEGEKFESWFSLRSIYGTALGVIIFTNMFGFGIYIILKSIEKKNLKFSFYNSDAMLTKYHDKGKPVVRVNKEYRRAKLRSRNKNHSNKTNLRHISISSSDMEILTKEPSIPGSLLVSRQSTEDKTKSTKLNSTSQTTVTSQTVQ